MDRFELAERRYRDIADENLPGMDRGTRYWRMPAARLRAWIDEYVLPAVEEVCDRPQFRDHATWPQRVLVRGADTPERAAVERVDRALVAEAKALRKLSRNRLVARALEEMTPRQEESATGSVTISSGGGRMNAVTPRSKAEQGAYWEGRRIEQDWRRHRKAWQMLWKLAANARIALPVNDTDLYGEHVSYSTMYNRWARLGPLLPPSLYRLVCGGAERATYRLDFPINKIHLFDSRGAGHGFRCPATRIGGEEADWRGR